MSDELDKSLAGRSAPPQPTGRAYIEHAQETARRVRQAIDKGQVALLVTDAQGVVIVGVKGTGGLTRFAFVPEEGIWHANLHLSGVTVLDGSYALRDMGLPERAGQWPPDYAADQPGGDQDSPELPARHPSITPRPIRDRPQA